MEKKIMIGIIGLLLFLSMFGCIETGKGVATDSIARVSNTGLIWKTWKVQLTNDHPTADSYEQYGIEHNDALIKELQDYAESGERVKLYYRQDLINNFWEYGDREIIYKVEKVK